MVPKCDSSPTPLHDREFTWTPRRGAVWWDVPSASYARPCAVPRLPGPGGGLFTAVGCPPMLRSSLQHSVQALEQAEHADVHAASPRQRAPSVTGFSLRHSFHLQTKRLSNGASQHHLGQSTSRFFPQDFTEEDDMEVGKALAVFSERLRGVGKCAFNKLAQGVFLPTSVFLKLWTVVLLVLIAWTALVTPFQVSFLDEGILSYSSVWFALERGADALFALDILINCNRAVLSDDGSRLVTNRQDIVLHYLKHGMLLDVAASIPWDLIAQAAWGDGTVGTGRGQSNSTPQAERLKIVRMVRLMQLLRLEHVFEGPKRWGPWVRDHLGLTYAQTQLISFLFGCVLIAHWLACAFHFTALVENGNCNWVNLYANNGVSCLPLPTTPVLSTGSRYIIALYWSVQTITTVGYGDVSPATDSERCVEIACMVIGAGMYAFVVGSVCGVVAQMTTRNVALEEVLDASSRLAQPALSGDTPTASACLETELLHRMRRYMRYVHGRGAKWAETDMVTLMPQLSPQLQQLYYARRRSTLRSCRLFWSLPEGALMKLCSCFTLVTFSPEERIQMPGHVVDDLYLLRHGMVVTYSITPTALRHIAMTGVRLKRALNQSPSSFAAHPALVTPVIGIEALWSLNKSSQGIGALTFTEALHVRKEQLVSVMATRQELFYCVRARSLACLLRETIRQMGVARRIVKMRSAIFLAQEADFKLRLRAAVAARNDAAVAAALATKPKFCVYALLHVYNDIADSTSGDGISPRNSAMLPQLTGALLMEVIQSASPVLWPRLVAAVMHIQRVFRHRRRHRAAAKQTAQPGLARTSQHALAPASAAAASRLAAPAPAPANVLTAISALAASVNALRGEMESLRAMNGAVLRTTTNVVEALVERS